MENALEHAQRMLAGPGAFRVIVQPAIAILLGILDGRADSHAGRTSAFSPGTGAGRFVPERIVAPLLLATGLSVLFQFVILGEARLWVAVAFAMVFVALPYLLARALARRVDARWHRTHRRAA
jgi:hypothetical protein